MDIAYSLKRKQSTGSQNYLQLETRKPLQLISFSNSLENTNMVGICDCLLGHKYHLGMQIHFNT